MEIGILILSTTVSLLLAIFILLRNPKSHTNKIFALLAFFLAVYPIFNYLTLNSVTSSSALFWSKLVLLSAIPAGPLYYLFVRVFPEDKLEVGKKVLLILFGWIILNSIFALSGLLFSVTIESGSVLINPGPAIPSFGILQASTILIGSWILFKKYRRSTGLLRSQLRFISYGISLGFGLTLFSTLFMTVLLNNSSLVIFSPVFITIATVSIGYSIIRHKLLDIQLVLARAVAYTLIIGIVGIFYTLSTILVSNLFFRDLSTNEQIILFTTLTLIVAFTFQPLRRYLQKITDRFFYKGRYDSSELLSKLTKIMATTLGLEDITKGLLTNLVPEIRVSKGAFVLIKKGRIDAVESYNYKDKPKFTGTDIDSLLEQEKILILEDLDNKKIKEIMTDLDLALAAPLKIGDEYLGMLLLGHKLSGEIYTEQDIKLLQILSPEISIAIKNAKAYEEIRKFNITLQREIQKATVDLKFANEKLKELDRLKDEFVSVASHELRTPMTAIKSYSWLVLEGKAGKVTPKIKTYLDKVYLSSERMIKLINDMLNVSRIESGKLKLEIQPTSIFKVAESVFSDLSVKAQEEKIKLKLEKDHVVPQAFVDPDKLSEIFTNLVGNSIKFTPEHGTVTISAQKERDMLMISVADTGTGISKENMSKLFSKFGRIEDSYVTSNTSMGTGLGLFIIKNYIEKMGGKIWVNSELGKGTVFTFSLPTTKTKQKKPVTVTTNENKYRHLDSKKS